MRNVLLKNQAKTKNNFWLKLHNWRAEKILFSRHKDEHDDDHDVENDYEVDETNYASLFIIFYYSIISLLCLTKLLNYANIKSQTN